LIVLSAVACSHPAPPVAPQPPPPPAKVTLEVLPADKKPFPAAAKAIADALSAAKVAGVDETKLSAVSMEVVQIQIECDDPTPDCYAAAGKELHVDRLLFAKIDPAGKKQVDVTITLFDVGGRAVTSAAHRVFATEAAAVAGVPGLVAEATSR
jgi:hypothetical protein